MLLFFLVVALLLPGCRKLGSEGWRQLDDETRAQRKYVNLFAWNAMNHYYLWREEIAPEMEAWENWEEPIGKVATVRYKDERGKDIDRWTLLTDDFASLQGDVSGHTRTLGLDIQLYFSDQTHTRIWAVVTFTFAGSPAEKAGIRRGDIIMTIDGMELTPDNYRYLVRERLLGGGAVSLGLSEGRSVTLQAVDMYEDPVHTALVLTRPDGKKVGYLHYASFTLDSCERLIEVFRSFQKTGIDDLVLDLRYNGGGYVIAERVLASMLAPLKEVEAQSVFCREIYNARLTEENKGQDICFETSFLYRKDGSLQPLSTKGANPGLSRLYVLVTGGSASASESLIGGLRPYMDVVVIGEQTYGKFCGGYLLGAPAWYDSVQKSLDAGEYEKALPYVDNWGIYVMYSRYADCNGYTLSMPDGIAPDVEQTDDPLDGYALGDPHETLLSVALGLIEGRTRSAEPALHPGLTPVQEAPHPRTKALRVLNP